jgi:hypothetical protein
VILRLFPQFRAVEAALVSANSLNADLQERIREKDAKNDQLRELLDSKERALAESVMKTADFWSLLHTGRSMYGTNAVLPEQAPQPQQEVIRNGRIHPRLVVQQKTEEFLRQTREQDQQGLDEFYAQQSN